MKRGIIGRIVIAYDRGVGFVNEIVLDSDEDKKTFVIIRQVGLWMVRFG